MKLFKVKNNGPVDLSALTTLTRLEVFAHSVSQLPRSLVECSVTLESDQDLSLFTDLTSLSVCLKSHAKLTFPTGLKKLVLKEEQLCDTNIGDFSLEPFESKDRKITPDVLEMLPKTLRVIVGSFNPRSLRTRLGDVSLH